MMKFYFCKNYSEDRRQELSQTSYILGNHKEKKCDEIKKEDQGAG